MAKQMPPQGGDLPTHARERLNIMRGDATHHSLFTSDLSVNEFLLVREAGFDPVGLVVGSSIYHIGYQRANWTQNQEMVVLTQAMYHARELVNLIVMPRACLSPQISRARISGHCCEPAIVP